MSRRKNIAEHFGDIVDEAKKLLGRGAKVTDETKALGNIDAIPHITDKLSDLSPGRFSRDQLDARLKGLSETATEKGLIDASLRADGKGLLSPKKAEEALLRGESISPREMRSLQDSKQDAFSKWEAGVAKSNTKLTAKTNDSTSPWSAMFASALKWPIAVLSSGLAVVGIGLGANQFLDGALVDTVKNASKALATNTEVSEAKARQEAFAQLQRTCLAQGAEAGEITNQCIIPRFSDRLSSLSDVFSKAGAKEAERVYVAKIGERLDLALTKSAGKLDDFTKLAEEMRVKTIKEIQNDPKYRENLPDFEILDASIQQALQNDPKFLSAFASPSLNR